MNPRVRMRGYGGAAIVVLTATVAWLMIQVPTLKDNADASSETATQALTKVSEVESQVAANSKALAEANARLIALGKTPVPVPPTPAPSPPVQVDEFTAEEAAAVRLIVADQIARTPAKLTQAEISQIARIAAALVPKPKDGTTPTAAELQPIVAATLAAYCVDDKCVGKDGADGKQGDRGEPGTDAPAVTDAQLLAAAQQALAAYCAQDSKPCAGTVGPTGPQGPQGAEGPAGRGIADTDCQEDGTWLITYSDGTKDTARGPCRIPVPPVETGN
jgi:hypothetical protein